MNKNKVEKLVEKSKSLGLMGIDFILGFSVDEICNAYNGIGPQFLPEKLRDKVTDLLHIFEPAALVHDLRFDNSDGTRESFSRANIEFALNCSKCAKSEYAWYSWKRYRAYAVIDAMNAFNCGEGGWKAWNDAFENKKRKRGN